MKMLRTLPVLSGLLLASLVSTAQAETIRFENAAQPGSVLQISSNQYNEAGYLLYSGLAVIASATAPNATGYGPAATSDFYAFCTCSTGASLSRTDGKLFSLQQFDVGSGQALYMNLHLVGTKGDNSSVTYDLSSDTAASQWSTIDLQLLGFSNLKSVSFTGSGPIGIALDNINVSQVPVPAAAWLFGSALAGLGLQAGRRKRA